MLPRTSKGQVINAAVSHRLCEMELGLQSASEVRELIANRAYQLYVDRGDECGDELSDWLRAEGEVVTMLLTESHVTSETEVSNNRPANRRVASSRIAKSANGASNRVGRRKKSSTALNGNPG